MPDSPASPTPYEVLGVRPTTGQEQLRRAYRLLLRQTHPDTGGSPVRFHAVQAAWELVGDPLTRAAYDRGHGEHDLRPARDGSARPSGSSLRARSHGQPGARVRARFVSQVRTAAGESTDPYDPAVVRSAPPETRRLLAKALAEEATAATVSRLGIAFTLWNDVVAGTPTGTIDHIVLAPAGLFALASEDWGGEVRLVRGEVTAEALAQGAAPIAVLLSNARAFERSAGVRFTAVVLVLPDGALAEPLMAVQHGRNAGAVLVRRSLLPLLLREGASGRTGTGFAGVFELRKRLTERIRFAGNRSEAPTVP